MLHIDNDRVCPYETSIILKHFIQTLRSVKNKTKYVYASDKQQYLFLSNVVPTYVLAPNDAFIKAPG